jgi:hypothetical protein
MPPSRLSSASIDRMRVARPTINPRIDRIDLHASTGRHRRRWRALAGSGAAGCRRALAHRRHASEGARQSPGAAGRPHAGGSRWRREGRSRPPGRGPVLLGAGRAPREADANKPPRRPIEPVLLTSRSVPKGTNRHRVESHAALVFNGLTSCLGAAATFSRHNSFRELLWRSRCQRRRRARSACHCGRGGLAKERRRILISRLPSAPRTRRRTHRLSVRAAGHAALFQRSGRDFPPRRTPISIAFRRPLWIRGRGACGATAIAARRWSARSGSQHRARFTPCGRRFAEFACPEMMNAGWRGAATGCP